MRTASPCGSGIADRTTGTTECDWAAPEMTAFLCILDSYLSPHYRAGGGSGLLEKCYIAGMRSFASKASWQPYYLNTASLYSLIVCIDQLEIR